MTTTATSEAVAAAEDLQAFVDRIAYVRCHMAAGEQATFDKLTGYPYISERTPPDPVRLETASVEVWRDGPAVWVSIRSQESVGKAIALAFDDVDDLIQRLHAARNTTTTRKIRDEPQA